MKFVINLPIPWFQPRISCFFFVFMSPPMTHTHTHIITLIYFLYSKLNKRKVSVVSSAQCTTISSFERLKFERIPNSKSFEHIVNVWMCVAHEFDLFAVCELVNESQRIIHIMNTAFTAENMNVQEMPRRACKCFRPMYSDACVGIIKCFCEQ